MLIFAFFLVPSPINGPHAVYIVGLYILLLYGLSPCSSCRMFGKVFVSFGCGPWALAKCRLYDTTLMIRQTENEKLGYIVGLWKVEGPLVC